MSEPKLNIFIGLLASIFKGSLMPIFGILLGNMLFVLDPIPYYNPLEKIRSDSNYYCGLMLAVAAAAFLCGFI